jgi:hypothetical protein
MPNYESDDDILAMLDDLLLEEIEIKTLDEYLEEALATQEESFWDNFDLDSDVADGEDQYSEDK